MSNVLSKELAINGGVGVGGRLFSGSIVSVIVMCCLFWAMQYMIKTGAKAATVDNSTTMPDFARARVVEKKVQPRKRLKQPTPPVEPPKQPRPQILENIGTQVNAIDVTATPVKTQVSMSNDGFIVGNIGEGGYLPIVKIAPIYPPIAAERGIEGYCTVMYTVNTNGRTSNIRVDPNDCTSSLFHAASIKAATKFKYKPKVRNGEAIQVPNVKNRFKYELQD